MTAFLRIVFSLALLALSGFCVFGFVATFEPMPPLQQWIWRVIYALVAALNAWAIVRLWRPKLPVRPVRSTPGPD